MKFITLGDLVADVVVSVQKFPIEAEQHQTARQIRFEPGGACNALITGARIGMEAQALGVVGDDPFGSGIIGVLKSEEVDTSSVLTLPDSETATVMVLVDRQGKNVFLGKYGEGPLIEPPPAWFDALDPAGGLLAFGYSFAEKRFIPAMLTVLERAFQKGCRTFFDPGPFCPAARQEDLERVLAATYGLLLTEEEIPFVAGGRKGLDAAKGMLNDVIRVVCVKRGPLGCAVFTRKQEVFHPGFEVEVQDVTAAGDAFDGAFVFGCLQGWALERAAAFANAVGAAKVQKLGSGRQVPTREEIRTFLKDHSVGIDI